MNTVASTPARARESMSDWPRTREDGSPRSEDITIRSFNASEEGVTQMPGRHSVQARSRDAVANTFFATSSAIRSSSWLRTMLCAYTCTATRVLAVMFTRVSSMSGSGAAPSMPVAQSNTDTITNHGCTRMTPKTAIDGGWMGRDGERRGFEVTCVSAG